MTLHSPHGVRVSFAMRKGIAILNPEIANAHAVLGNVFLAMGAAEESVAALRRSLECDPDNIVAHANLIFALPFLSDFPEVLMRECSRFAAQREAPVFVCERERLNNPAPNRRLRVGYVYGNFDSHYQSLFTIPLLSNHNHADFEIFCYSSVAEPDHVTASIRGLADVWRDVRALDDATLAQQIRADRVDILVDLTMHMEGSRRLLFARRPAPVQVAWLAYPGTTGSPAMDYRLSDCWLDPVGEPGRDALYSERTIRLPQAFWCYDPLTGGLAVNNLPAANGEPFTFGCLNNPAKVSDHALGLWAGALAAVPESRLLVLEPRGVPRSHLTARYVAHGIDPSRVYFVARQPRRKSWAARTRCLYRRRICARGARIRTRSASTRGPARDVANPYGGIGAHGRATIRCRYRTRISGNVARIL
ncbi:hypothetical protein PWR63_20185 [Paraburkholderia sp. A2WS-5]|uniref:O-linked N-acetylglucosamine transferase, SPINDLY family protein n=1 Tax=unclassified Paraburkholderia TaxID=2615204 RepID=UPI003B7CB0A3